MIKPSCHAGANWVKSGNCNGTYLWVITDFVCLCICVCCTQNSMPSRHYGRYELWFTLSLITFTPKLIWQYISALTFYPILWLPARPWLLWLSGPQQRICTALRKDGQVIAIYNGISLMYWLCMTSKSTLHHNLRHFTLMFTMNKHINRKNSFNMPCLH